MIRGSSSGGLYLTIALAVAVSVIEPAESDGVGADEPEVKSEALIEGLRRPEPAPAEPVRTRGIALLGAAEERVKRLSCAQFRELSPGRNDHEEDSPTVAVKIPFATNSDVLSTDSISTLGEIGRALQSQELGKSCFRLEGHTDGLGSEEYNLRLSEKRAQSVTRYLVESLGVDAERLIPRGLGESRPIADNSTPEGRQKNRRVQIVNLGYGELKERADP